MKLQELLPGSKVDIRILQLAERADDPTTEKSVYYSTIFDVGEDNTIEVNMPTIAGKLQLLQKNIRYEFIFTTSSGMYRAQGTVTEHMKRERFYLLKIHIDTDLERFQRRRYFRMECMIPLIFMGLTPEVAALPTMQEIREYIDNSEDMKVRGIGTMLDISGGGTRFITSNSLQDIPFILIKFQLECQKEHKEIDVVGRIVASEKAKNSEKYVHRVEFFFKDNQLKERVITYVFDEQRRLRKKESDA
jgi:c-di-GMP-binding flagellar brake protein YcgR